LLPIAGVI